MIQFKENAPTDGRTDRMDRLYFIGSFQLPPGVQKVLFLKLKFHRSTLQKLVGQYLHNISSANVTISISPLFFRSILHLTYSITIHKAFKAQFYCKTNTKVKIQLNTASIIQNWLCLLFYFLLQKKKKANVVLLQTFTFMQPTHNIRQKYQKKYI